MSQLNLQNGDTALISIDLPPPLARKDSSIEVSLGLKNKVMLRSPSLKKSNISFRNLYIDQESPSKLPSMNAYVARVKPIDQVEHSYLRRFQRTIQNVAHFISFGLIKGDHGNPLRSSDDSDSEQEALLAIASNNKLPASLLDQLEHLSKLIHQHGLSEPLENSKKLLDFCQLLMKPFANKPKVELDVKPIHKLMGQIIFLANRNLSQLNTLIDISTLEKTIERINQSFDTELKQIFAHVALQEDLHEKAELQDSRQARAIYLPIELAKALVTDVGLLNNGLIPFFKDKLSHLHRLSLPYELDILHILNNLEHAPLLKTTLNSIRKPKNKYAPAHFLIRTLLKLSPQHIVTDTDARRVALTALFSHLRQGTVGSCFSTFLALHLLANDPHQALLDFKSLLETSSLHRSIKGVKFEFPFLSTLGTEASSKRITLKTQGYIISSNALKSYIWEAPGIQSVCRVLGIVNVKGCVTAALKKLFTDPLTTPIMKVSIKKLLQLIIEEGRHYGLEKTNSDAILLEKALFIFEGETHNVLQGIWENSIAGMAETQESSYLKPAIIDSILTPIKEKISSLNTQTDPEWQRLLNLLSQCLMKRMQLQYDPHLERDEPIADNYGTAGGFVLYDQYHEASPSEWKRIDQGIAFQQFTQSLLEEATSLLKKDRYDPKKIILLERGVETLTSYINSTSYLLAALCRYHQALGLSNNLQVNEHTPWVDKSGNNPLRVLNTYFEQEKKEVLCSLLPSNCHQFLKHLIDYGKNLKSTGALNNALQHPNQSRPVYVVGNHALSILFGSYLFKDACASLDTNQWIQERVIRPGKKIADTKISAECRQKLLTHASHHIPEGSKKHFQSNLLLLSPNATVKEFRQDLIDIIIETIPSYLNRKTHLEKEIDTFLCQEALSGKDRESLRESAIHVADTNWKDSVHDYHFCFLVNPGTGKLEMWQIQENGTHLVPLDQNHWVYNQNWQML